MKEKIIDLVLVLCMVSFCAACMRIAFSGTLYTVRDSVVRIENVGQWPESK